MLSVQNLNVTFNTRKGNVDAVKETTNNLKMAMDNQALIQDQNKRVLSKIEVMRDDFKSTTTTMQSQVIEANEQLSGEISNFSGQLSSTVSETLISQMNGQLAQIEALINGIQDAYTSSLEGVTTTLADNKTMQSVADTQNLLAKQIKLLEKKNNEMIKQLQSRDDHIKFP